MVGKEIGADKARAGYDLMVGGGLLVPPAKLYAGCLKVEPYPVRPFQLGFARSSLNDARVVRDVVPGSAAEQAGLRDGDVIVDAGDINEVRKDSAKALDLTVRRGETVAKLSFLPRGAAVQGYRWARDPATPDSACRF